MLKENDRNEARAGVEAGEYDVDFLVRVVGTLRVGDDYTSHIVSKADPWTLLAVALSHLNNKTIASIVKEAEDVKANDNRIEEIKNEVRKALAQVKKPTLTECRGPVTTKIDAMVSTSKGKKKSLNKHSGMEVEESWDSVSVEKQIA
jgi:hypothetical protein